MITKYVVEQRLKDAGYQIRTTTIRNLSYAYRITSQKDSLHVVFICDDKRHLYVSDRNVDYAIQSAMKDARFPGNGKITIEYIMVILNDWNEKAIKQANVIQIDRRKGIMNTNKISAPLREECELIRSILIASNCLEMAKKGTLNMPHQLYPVKMTYVLMAINILAYIVLGTNSKNYGISSEQMDIFHLVSYMFMHGGIIHLGFNMLSLFIVGKALEKNIGAMKLFWIYVIAGIYGAILSLIVHANNTIVTVGASGAIYGLMGALLIYSILTVTNAQTNNVRKCLYVIMISLINGFFMPNVDNACHIGGFISGIMFQAIFYFSDSIEWSLRHIKNNKIINNVLTKK